MVHGRLMMCSPRATASGLLLFSWILPSDVSVGYRRCYAVELTTPGLMFIAWAVLSGVLELNDVGQMRYCWIFIITLFRFLPVLRAPSK
ncbi:hypothetical protein BDN70DRAFT_47746 [Pholiota conissans]|uniref:Uncharacterized protein n=1 Tax=Pholiota conissans TaxID=109636 RepID=A0A9P5YLT5_9AGAR|nr:hypothetical protein BDN70DRAFT_47746 [Pholiota conissans]